MMVRGSHIAKLAGVAVSMGAVVAFATSPAHADTPAPVAVSEQSPKYGYGYSEVTYDEIDGTMWQRTCDAGPADGLRAVSFLRTPTGTVHTLHAASGSGSCVQAGYVLRQGTYTLKVCLRNGATGSDIYCGFTEEWTVY
ncbi:hypothetical protein [Streptomyces flaveolus]|uniref:hypothetical protein n=1 Tax=Streptomyces flaveolus TaxID=67297 RepID=UPI0033241F42